MTIVCLNCGAVYDISDEGQEVKQEAVKKEEKQ